MFACSYAVTVLRSYDKVVAAIKGVAAGAAGEAVSERKRAFGGGQNSTLKAVSEQRRGKSASRL